MIASMKTRQIKKYFFIVQKTVLENHIFVLLVRDEFINWWAGLHFLCRPDGLDEEIKFCWKLLESEIVMD